MYTMNAPKNVTCQREQLKYLPKTHHLDRVLMSLDAALQRVAEASFYEDKLIRPAGFGLYTVEDTNAHMSDDWVWDHEHGLLDWDSVSETSGLMDPYERFDRSAHIRYHMPDAIEALQDGHDVEFAYAAVDHEYSTFEHDEDVCPGPEECTCDTIVGWILCAQWDNDADPTDHVEPEDN